MRLASRISENSGFLAALLIFILSVVGGTGFTLLRQQSEAIRSNLAFSALYAHVFEDQLTDGLRYAELVVMQALEASDLNREQSHLASQFEKAVRQTAALRSLSLLDAGGRIVASSNPGNLGVRPDVADCLPPDSGVTDYFGIGELWRGRDFADGSRQKDPSADRDASPGFIPIVRRLHMEGQTITLLATVNPEYFVNNFALKLPHDQGFAEVFRYDGKRLLSTADPRSGFGSPTHPGFLRALPDIEFATGEETLADGTETLHSFRASSRYPLVVVTHLYRSQALQKWDQERRLLLLIVSPTLLLVVVLTILLYRHQRRVAAAEVESRQREHERLAATVFATVDEAVVVTNQDDAIIEANTACLAVTGFSPQELVGRKPSELLSTRYEASFREAVIGQIGVSGSWRGEVWSRHKNGTDYIGWLSIKQVCDGRGTPTHKVLAFSNITDRKATEEAQLRAVLEASPEAVLLVQRDGRICYANAVSERTFRYAAAELTQLGIEDLVPHEFRTRHRKLRHEFDGDPRSRPMASGLRLSALRKDGTTFPAEISLSHIRMSGETMVIASVGDISQRIHDEEALRSSEERWKFALEGAGEGVWDWDLVADRVYFSKRVLEILGDPEVDAEFTLSSWTSRIFAEDLTGFASALSQHLDGNTEGFAVEHRAMHRNGRWKWIFARGIVVARSAEGKALRMIGTLADIDERKKNEQDFRDLLQFNQSIVANSFSGIMVHRATGECVMANESAARISGGTVAELLRHNFLDSEAWREAGARAAAEKALATGSPVEFESPMRTFFGKSMWCVASFGRLTFKGEVYLLTVFSDLSARKEAENALLRAKENAESLLDRARLAERRIIDISEETRKKIGQELHDDLGQHLTGVAFLSEVLSQKLQSSALPEMEESTHITSLINEAVAKTRRLAQGLYPVELREAGLHALLSQAARNVESIYGVRCETSVDRQLEIDDDQVNINLFRIAQEAINNAIRHGHATWVQVELKRESGTLVFSISDNGGGFDVPHAEASGAGLGMHTMRYRASLIGAGFEIHSRAGEGTRITVNLPYPCPPS